MKLKLLISLNRLYNKPLYPTHWCQFFFRNFPSILQICTARQGKSLPTLLPIVDTVMEQFNQLVHLLVIQTSI